MKAKMAEQSDEMDTLLTQRKQHQLVLPTEEVPGKVPHDSCCRGAMPTAQSPTVAHCIMLSTHPTCHNTHRIRSLSQGLLAGSNMHSYKAAC